MTKAAKSYKLPFQMKTMSKDEQILRYADESRRFQSEAKGAKALLYLLVDALIDQPQFAAVREQVEQHLNKSETILAASAMQKHIEEHISRGGSGVVIPGDFDPVTYGGEFDERFLEPRSVGEGSSSVVILDGSFLEPKLIEEKSNDKKPSVVIPGYDAITY